MKPLKEHAAPAARSPNAKIRAASLGPADWPLHPFLFAAWSVFTLYASNLREMVFAHTLWTLGGALGAALVVFAAFGLLARRFGPKAAIMASIVLVVGLAYDDLASWLNGLIGNAIPAEGRLPAMLALAAVLLAAVWFAPFRLTLPNALLNGIALVLLATPAWKAAAYEWQTVRGKSPSEIAVFEADAALARQIAAGGPRERPDIYYIILDRYASQSTLLRDLRYDNSEFLSFLRDRGFYVAEESHANYPKTAPSVASSLHMDYLDFLVGDPRARRSEWHPIYSMVDDHRVGRFLEALGYDQIQIGAWWRPTQQSVLADESMSFGFSEFGWLYLRETIVPPLLEAIAPESRLAAQTRWDNGQCQRVPRQFEAIKAVADRPEPTFTFAHVLLPHEPFVFAADGKCVGPEQSWNRGFKAGYLGQLRYANDLVRDMVDSLLSRPGPKPVIIIQADEGPVPQRYRTSGRSWREATGDEIRMKTAILNAYYLPSGDRSALYPDITPVNTFRLVFNQLFGTDFERLPDRVYMTPDVLRIYEFFDVTEIVRPGAD